MKSPKTLEFSSDVALLFTMNSPEWKKFERIVAAIHIARSKGAKVTWNEEIDGHQFDVAVRVNDGMYEYLTLIECKRLTSPVPVEKVEAFATKSKGARANKAVIISSSGFQSGCIKVAKENNIGLITLSNVTLHPGSGGHSSGLAWYAHSFSIEMVDGKSIRLPKEWEANGRLQYVLRRSVLSVNDSRICSIEELLAWTMSQEQAVAANVASTFRFELNGYCITIPELCESSLVSAINFQLELSDGIPWNGPSFDPTLIKKMSLGFRLYDEITQKDTVIQALGLPLGFDTQLCAGKFYVDPNTGHNYHVESISGCEARIALVESYTHGHLLQIRFIQKLDFQHFYVEISDATELERLTKMYQRMGKGTL